MAEQRKTLMMSMTRKRMPNATHKYSIHGGLKQAGGWFLSNNFAPG
jgi:hypothetical protein